MNVIIPLCGIGKRFSDFGYDTIKPLIEINKKSIINYVLDRLCISSIKSDICIIINENVEKYDFTKMIKNNKRYSKINIINIQNYTLGAADTVYKGIIEMEKKRHFKYNKTIILDGDSFYTFDILQRLVEHDNALLYFEDNGDISQYSYMIVDENNNLKNIVEKKRISNNANCGAYMFGSIYLLKNVLRTILNKQTLYNEYYMSICMNELLNIGEEIACIKIQNNNFVSLGTPQQTDEYKKKSVNLLFDLDGTIVDTDSTYIAVWKQILSPHGFDVDNNFYNKYILGNSDVNVCNNLSIEYTKFISEEKDKLFVEKIMDISLIAGVYDFIKGSFYEGNNISIVTNCNSFVAEKILEYTNLLPLVDNIISADKCIKHKPYPEPYILAHEYYNNNANTIIFEDSNSGLTSASAFGPTHLIGIINEKNKKIINNFKCDMIIKNYIGLDTKKIQNNEKEKFHEKIKTMIKKQFKFDEILNIIIHQHKLKGGFIADILAIDIVCKKKTFNSVLKLKKINNSLKNDNSIMLYMADKLNLFDTECYFYESIADYVNINIPKKYCILRYDDMSVCGILMERIEGDEYILNLNLNENDVSITKNLIKNIADMHIFFMNKNLKKNFGGLHTNNENIFWSEFVMEKKNDFLNNWKYVLNDETKLFIEKSVKSYKDIQNRLSDENLTLCHGDFKSPNIFYKKINNNEYVPYILDWQYITEGKGIQDIVFLIIESFSEKNIELYAIDILNYYYNIINEHTFYDRQQYINDVIDSIGYFPVLVAIWFGTVENDQLIDKNFPYQFIQKLSKMISIIKKLDNF